LPTVCARNRKLNELKRGTHIEGYGDESDCTPNKYRYKYLTKPRKVDDLLGLSVPYAHRPCCHNELVALHNRVMSPPFSVDWVGRRRIKIATELVRVSLVGVHLVKLSRRAYVDSVKNSSKKNRYENALINLIRHGLVDSDGKVELSIKVEPIDGIVKGSADPRPIQARSPEFNIEYGRFIKPIEKYLVKHKYAAAFGLKQNGRNFAKGLNNVQRANLIRQKFVRFREPVVVGVDASRFDQSVDKPWLESTHDTYQSLFCEDDELITLEQCQLSNRGRTRKGYRFRSKAGRASGDQDTGLGNSDITSKSIGEYLRRRQIDGDWLCDGDDALVFLEKDELVKMQYFAHDMQHMGFKMTIEQPVYDMEDIEFCQCKPVEVRPDKWVMVRKPRRAIQRALSSNTTMGNIKQALKVMYAVGMCEGALHAGIPIMQAFASWCRRNGQKCSDKMIRLLVERNHSYWELPKTKILEMPIHDVARESFSRAFDIAHNLQREIELIFETHNYVDWSEIDGPEPLDPGYGKIEIDSLLVYR
jgi:hypothetical protein